MTYRNVLSFLLGLEGASLLRAYAGDTGLDEAFALRRVDEIEVLLQAYRSGELGDARTAVPISTVDGYRAWAASYDSEDNPLIEVEAPFVQKILTSLPVGRAVDAACGTGRHARFLNSLGHEVIGVDSSTEMLAVARQQLPTVTFLEGDLTALPLPDESAGVVVCGLALAHVPDLQPVFAEFARVLTAAGHLVISDMHFLSLYFGGVASAQTADGQLGLMPASRWKASDYLGAARDAGFAVRGCAEPSWPPSDTAGGPLARRWCPEAADAAYAGIPAAVIWHFQKAPACL